MTRSGHQSGDGMIELFGFPVGTLFQGGTFAAMLALFAIVARVWIMGMPARKLAANEAERIENEVKVAAAAELADRFKAWREEVHGLKNELMGVAHKQTNCDKALTAATTLNEQLMFLIELMIAELEILDPKSKTVARARQMFSRIAHTILDPKKSATVNTAEMAVQDAKQVLTSTKETCEEVKKEEGGK